MRMIKFKKRTENAKEPIKPDTENAGYDFFCTTKIKTDKYIQYNTGISLEIPKGMVGLLFPRSSVTNKDLILKNCVGVIDHTYRGEIVARFYDTSDDEINKDQYSIGDRVCQILFLDLPDVGMIESDILSETDRNERGFGSSGYK